MDQRYLYLLLNIGTIVVPFLFSFHPKLNFHKAWKRYLPAISITALIFIAWDSWFTKMGVWGFNDQYLSGIYIANLPLEEVLFFFTIPYACMFTYHAFNCLVKRNIFEGVSMPFTVMLILMLVVVGSLSSDKWYTSVTFLSLSALLILLMLTKHQDLLGRFYLSFVVLLIPFGFVNGILTGTWINEPVVWYNNEENLGIRIGTIPVEDVFYAMLMLLPTTAMAHIFERKPKLRH